MSGLNVKPSIRRTPRQLGVSLPDGESPVFELYAEFVGLATLPGVPALGSDMGPMADPWPGTGVEPPAVAGAIVGPSDGPSEVTDSAGAIA